MNLTAALTKTTVRLSHEMGRGGEGVVYSTEGRADQVAKLYHELPTTGKAQKLVYMAGLTTPALLKVSAWPIDVLVTAKGEPRGVVMQRLSTGRDIRELYSPKSRFDRRKGGGWAFVISMVLALFFWPRTPYPKKLEADRKVSAARSEWDNLLTRWKREASASGFHEQLKAFEKRKQEYIDLPNLRRRMLVKLDSNRKDAQLKRYLDRFRIDRGGIKHIGPSRTAMLASYGVETAADIHPKKVPKIPEFGDFLTSELLAWRDRHEKNFRFNPNEPVDSRDIAEMERQLETKRQAWKAQSA